jgi:endonuclease YncB( thermonuclease family)
VVIIRITFLSATLAFASSAANADTLAGRATVIDADTIEIHGERIRILDIDAPESRQPCFKPDGPAWRCGQQASLALADWIGQRTVTCDATKKDKYKRWLARCTVAGEALAVWLAAQGWGVPYRDCKCEVVRDAADKAKLAKLGIWSSEFQMPWEWRDRH